MQRSSTVVLSDSLHQLRSGKLAAQPCNFLLCRTSLGNLQQLCTSLSDSSVVHLWETLQQSCTSLSDSSVVHLWEICSKAVRLWATHLFYISGKFAAKLYVSERLIYCTSLGNLQQSCMSLTDSSIVHLWKLAAKLYISGKCAAKLYVSEWLLCSTSLGNLQQSCTYLRDSSNRK